MPLINNFQNNSILSKFILNSIASSIVIIIALLVNNYLDKSESKITILSAMVTFSITFAVSMAANVFMYYVFGYGK